MIELKSDILYRAIDRQINIELRHADKKPEDVLFLSRFFAYDPGERIIVIDFPTASSELNLLKKGDPVIVKFIYRGSPFVCNSYVMGLTTYDTYEVPKNPAMIIRLPDKILGNERRQFLKVNTPPFEVAVRVNESRDYARGMTDRIYRALTVNISGGGIAITGKSDKMRCFKGDVIDLHIDFPDKPLHMQGEVLNIYRFEKTDRESYGIRFIELDQDKRTFRINVQRIIRYVTRRERQLLAR